MAALTADKGLQHQGTLELRAFVMKASTTIYKGAIVAVDTNGVALPAADVASYRFVGIAAEKVVSAASGTYYIPVYVTGCFLLDASGVEAADVGAGACFLDDQTVTDAAGTTNVDAVVGLIVERVSTTGAWVDIGQRPAAAA